MINLSDKSPKILVIGDLIIDQYYWGSCERVSPEAPVPIINIEIETAVLGGAGNVVNNLKKLGSNVDIVSVIGKCKTSVELKKHLNEIGVETKFLIEQKDRTSSKKTRVISSQQQVVRYDRESTEDINSHSQELIKVIINNHIMSYDAVLLSDYGKGILTTRLTQFIIQVANKNNKKVLIDPKGINFSKYKGAYLLTPNRKEASQATKIDLSSSDNLSKAIMKLKQLCDLDVSLITLSENGIAVYDNDLRIHPTNAKEIYDVTGAGDTVLASIGFAIASGFSIDEAVQFSNLAAGVVIGKIGSATASLNEIIEYESSINKSSSDKHIKAVDEITSLVIDLKEREKKIVFTNGCFDLLHAGHVNYLEKAKSFGDILILGLNSDASVRKIKGEERPINTESDRAYILASIEVVDYVVIFHEDTPYELIKAIKPHTLVKGGDYLGKEVVGQDIAGELQLVEFIEGKSSSTIISKIKKISS
jgi:D-beta-D-heptose 7-phosphate kinase / D-beta-D-heptose 1-phosphate adenosyltransferase